MKTKLTKKHNFEVCKQFILDNINSENGGFQSELYINPKTGEKVMKHSLFLEVSVDSVKDCMPKL